MAQTGVQPAIILRRIPFRDSSLVVSLFTQDHGVRAVMARGARKGSKTLPRGDLAGYHTLGVQLGGREGQNMLTLRSAEILQPRHGLLHQRVGSSAAQLMLEQVYRLLPVEDANPKLFGALQEALDRLEAGEAALEVVGLWQGFLLHNLGFGWQVAHCAGCGGETDLRFFSTKRNQTVCAPCGTPHRHRLLPLPEGVLAVMRGQPGGAADQAELVMLTTALLAQHGEKVLHAQQPFFRAVGLA
ncbi:DNA replication and repair protein RecO [Magnetococcus marinus MC-1]|uniref:DNA repair protein RecO n=1 Tax=Magnetococcus marinus (strain ATCC BAA-1437 / JCM 17883 / MC-1) TaxID=156889 RepID=A0L635_MAGMM|nr:DNA repair protein RecO [Magnetococcus marinus]ABK43428.1 DNA replication and repair protein RecO [Magnetococcus marinus MC-1]